MAISLDPKDHEVGGGGVPEAGTYQMGEVRAMMNNFNGVAPREIACIIVPLIDPSGEAVSTRYYACGDSEDKKRFRASANNLSIESDGNQPLHQTSGASIFLQACIKAGYPGTLGSDLSVLDGTTWTWDRRPKRGREGGEWVNTKTEVYPASYVSGAKPIAALNDTDDDTDLEILADWLLDHIDGPTTRTDLGKLVRGSPNTTIANMSSRIYSKELAAKMVDRGIRVQGNEFLPPA